MKQSQSTRSPSRPSLSFWMLVIFLLILWVAGGSARADAPGQIVVRLAAWALMVAYILSVSNTAWEAIKPITILLAVTVASVCLHLVPLPPAIWSALPSRDVLIQTATVVGVPQPWRPLSISPSATINALGSLIVPTLTLALAGSLHPTQQHRIADLLLALIFFGCLLGLLQFSGARFDNPLINELQGFVSGNFANRNHLALFAAIGIVVALALALRDSIGRTSALLRVLVVPFFAMIILATGSRSGLALGVIAVGGGLIIGRKQVVKLFRHLSIRWAVAGFAGAAAVIGLAVYLSVSLGRAEAIDRLALDPAEDLRIRALPVVTRTIEQYFPAGSGFGTFDPAYRIVEPDNLLGTLYFNHAHSDWLEVALDGGLVGIVLLGFALAWWLKASIRILRSGHSDVNLAQSGSAICLLAMIASITDYPVRTPMIMAVVVLGAVWMVIPNMKRKAPDTSGAVR